MKEIRGLKIAAIARWVLLGLVTLLAARTVWSFWGPSPDVHSAHQENRYYCPMHPQIRSPDPGQCPICHMDLEPIPKERAENAKSQASTGGFAPGSVVPVTLSQEKQESIGLTTSLVTAATLGDSLRVPGVVSAPETGQSQVRVRAAGFVERVAVRQTGIRVQRGQTLAWVYSPEIYRAQEEFLAATRWNTAPSTPGVTRSPASDIVPAARRGLELLGLTPSDIDEIARTGKALRAIPVRAPSSGYVTRFNAVLGSRADPETILYELADLSTVWVIASVHERDLVNIRTGMKAKFAVTGQSAASVEVRVELIEPALDEATRTSRVRLTLNNKAYTLRPGQFGEVSFELPTATGLFVPAGAVIHTGELQYLYVASDSERFEPRAVHTGLEANGQIQILDGAHAGERVVTRGSFMLDSESRLNASLQSGSGVTGMAGAGARAR